MQQDAFERLVLPGLLWQPMVAAVISLSSAALDGAHRALQYANDLGTFPLGFLIVAAAATSVVLFGALNEVLCQSLYHWGWLHGRAWDRARRGGRLPEILPYTAIDRAIHCAEPWPEKTFYQRLEAYLKCAVGSTAKKEERGARDYSGLAADIIYQLVLSHVGAEVPEHAWTQFANERRLEQRLIRLSTSVPVPVIAVAIALVGTILRAVTPNVWSAPLAASFWAIAGSILVAVAGVWAAVFLRGYYHAQAILVWVHGNNVLCRLFYGVWPRIEQQHSASDPTSAD